MRALKIIIVLLIILAAALAAILWIARPLPPGEFYKADVPPGAKPGTLLRSEPFAVGIPERSRGWRILYVTTNRDDKAILASAVVVAPTATKGPYPVIAWSHGTIGVSPGCAPSLQDRPFANVPAFQAIVSEGWVYVGSDYAGLGTIGPHPYLEGEGEARSELDAVRAARQLDGLDLDSRIVVWGHSQGGHAALWAGIIAPRYAPDLNIVGIAAAAPATDLPALLRAAQETAIGRILSSYVVTAYAAIYPDVDLDSVVRDGRRWAARDLSGRCLAGMRGIITAFAAASIPGTLLAGDPADAAFGTRLRENRPAGPIAVPLLIQQGLSDQLVLPPLQEKFVAARCAAGQRLTYRTYAGLDHVALVGPDSPANLDLVLWTKDRFGGVPQEPGCTGDIAPPD